MTPVEERCMQRWRNNGTVGIAMRSRLVQMVRVKRVHFCTLRGRTGALNSFQSRALDLVDMTTAPTPVYLPMSRERTIWQTALRPLRHLNASRVTPVVVPDSLTPCTPSVLHPHHHKPWKTPTHTAQPRLVNQSAVYNSN